MMAAIWLAAPHAPMALYPVWLLLLAGRVSHTGSCAARRGAFAGAQDRGTTGFGNLSGLSHRPSTAMRHHRLRHHRDNGLPDDPYFKRWIGKSRLRLWLMSVRCFRLLSLWVLRGVYGSIAAYAPALRNSYGRLFLQDRYGHDLTNSREVILCAREDRWQLLFHACTLGIAGVHWHWFVVYYIVPAVLGGYLAGYRLLMEHTQEPNYGQSFRTTIRSTSDHDLGLLGWLLFAPHNVGYHRVHHLHPQAALENLPELRNWYAAHYPDIYPA
jgi:fatty acid desaturase